MIHKMFAKKCVVPLTIKNLPTKDICYSHLLNLCLSLLPKFRNKFFFLLFFFRIKNESILFSSFLLIFNVDPISQCKSLRNEIENEPFRATKRNHKNSIISGTGQSTSQIQKQPLSLSDGPFFLSHASATHTKTQEIFSFRHFYCWSFIQVSVAIQASGLKYNSVGSS